MLFLNEFVLDGSNGDRYTAVVGAYLLDSLGRKYVQISALRTTRRAKTAPHTIVELLKGQIRRFRNAYVNHQSFAAFGPNRMFITQDLDFNQMRRKTLVPIYVDGFVYLRIYDVFHALIRILFATICYGPRSRMLFRNQGAYRNLQMNRVRRGFRQQNRPINISNAFTYARIRERLNYMSTCNINESSFADLQFAQHNQLHHR